jgi:hypothetical protein
MAALEFQREKEWGLESAFVAGRRSFFVLAL